VWLEGGLVVVPYRTSAGELYADRVIAGSGRRWWSPGDGRPVIPFGLDRLERLAFRRYRALAICEGESDALALSAAFKGDGVDVLGVPGAGTWKPEWAVHAVGYSAVYVAGDGDAAGRAPERNPHGARRKAARTGGNRNPCLASKVSKRLRAANVLGRPNTVCHCQRSHRSLAMACRLHSGWASIRSWSSLSCVALTQRP